MGGETKIILKSVQLHMIKHKSNIYKMQSSDGCKNKTYICFI